MAQLAIYLDDETAYLLDKAAREAGKSRSAWLREVVQEKLSARLPDSFFAVLGSWEGDEAPEDLLRTIREQSEQPARQVID